MILPQWPAPKNVKALATEREVSSPLGISLPPYEQLNLGDHVGDQSQHVVANRRQLLNTLSHCDDIRWLQQIHGTECLDAASIANGAQADASFTQQKQLACAVMTADCLPVLFCDLQGRQVAAAHAGWKGLANGVLETTLGTFVSNGIPPEQVIAWMGPAITQSAFEVGPEVRQAFMHFKGGERWADDGCFMAGAGDRLQANLYRLAKLQMKHLGIAGVYGGDEDWCTFAAKKNNGKKEYRFFSYRREAITGRQASLIWLAD